MGMNKITLPFPPLTRTHTCTCTLTLTHTHSHMCMHMHVHTGGMEGVPSILRQECEDAGDLIGNTGDLALVQRGQASAIPIGCDVCIQETAEVWLRIECPTNIADFPDLSVTITWEDEEGNMLQGDGNTLLVQTPGTYTCIADFGGGDIDRESTAVGCKFTFNFPPCSKFLPHFVYVEELVFY